MRQMAKQNNSIGYLFLYFLANNPNKHNRIEASCYYEFVDVMKKNTNKEQLCQDMNVSIFLCRKCFYYERENSNKKSLII